MNSARIVLLLFGLVLIGGLASCSSDMTEAQYSARAEEFLRSGDEEKALEVLRKGIYRYPDDYELNLLMARAILARYADFTPRARSRYLARHYLRKAASAAPDHPSADAALRQYESIREGQRGFPR